MTHRGIFILFSLTLPLAICSYSQSASAEDVYTWRNKNGTTSFGSTPPKNATGVKKLKTPSISHYSTEKLLEGYGHKEKDETEQNAATNQEIDSTEKSNPSTTTSATSPAKLEKSKLTFSLNDSHEISDCQVLVKNIGNEHAHGILVRFEFEDGSIISGAGPEDLAPQAEGTYKVPMDQLPIVVTLKKGSKEPAGPKASITFY